MFSQKQLISLVEERCGLQNLSLDSEFAKIGLDSTAIIDLMIELEVILNIDVLDNRLQLDEMIRLGDVYEYVRGLSGMQSGSAK
ncbi:phosphopantetheine-binding protein [Paenibacillus tarimensis]|uniref:phosphopantetheine-binding protein n=1 Tax=Paenibacillus tarimensis TaxID=416012 RepID=UPI001F1EC88A|nr:phosphopantetheine-binding protein [Paenibacillus tarimensis]MCF2945191.1 phosphopantetheine-binding protein [Paenibacillus tarimensis]